MYKPQFKRTKRFLFNKDSKYGKRELIVNWILWLSVFLAILFFILFFNCLLDLNIDSKSDVALKVIPEPANSFCITCFGSILSLMTCLTIKAICKFKRRHDEKGI